MKKIKMVDLQNQYLRIKPEVDSAIQQVLDTTSFIQGPAVKEFADALGAYNQISHVIPCANGTDALQIALMALDLVPGDEGPRELSGALRAAAPGQGGARRLPRRRPVPRRSRRAPGAGGESPRDAHRLGRRRDSRSHGHRAAATLVATLAAALSPAFRAGRVSPVDAIRIV